MHLIHLSLSAKIAQTSFVKSFFILLFAEQKHIFRGVTAGRVSAIINHLSRKRTFLINVKEIHDGKYAHVKCTTLLV